MTERHALPTLLYDTCATGVDKHTHRRTAGGSRAAVAARATASAAKAASSETPVSLQRYPVRLMLPVSLFSRLCQRFPLHHLANLSGSQQSRVLRCRLYRLSLLYVLPMFILYLLTLLPRSLLLILLLILTLRRRFPPMDMMITRTVPLYIDLLGSRRYVEYYLFAADPTIDLIHSTSCSNRCRAWIVNYDVANGAQFDIVDDTVWDRLLAEVSALEYVACIASPPCNTYSRLHSLPGPPPLRDVEGSGRYGRSDLSPRSKEHARKHTLISTLNSLGFASHGSSRLRGLLRIRSQH